MIACIICLLIGAVGGGVLVYTKYSKITSTTSAVTNAATTVASAASEVKKSV